MRRVHTGGMVVLAVAVLMLPALAGGQAVITNGLISLGVNTTGSLNYNDVGVKYLPTGNDGTIYGCACEGWGVGISGGGWDHLITGANESTEGHETMLGTGSIGPFVSTASTATSTTYLLDESGNKVMSIVQTYSPSTSPNLYQVTVTLTNLTGGDLGVGPDGIRYRREMDWDIAPTAFDEYVTIRRGTAADLLHSSDNGFVNSDVFTPLTDQCGDPSVDVDITRSGPCDHGSAFDFGFASLAAGGSKTFDMFYGAAGNEADARTALGIVGAEVYSLASCDPAANSACTTDGKPNTFAWGFAGVGGTAIEPPPPVTSTPEPATLALFGTGMGGIALRGLARRRRKP